MQFWNEENVSSEGKQPRDYLTLDVVNCLCTQAAHVNSSVLTFLSALTPKSC